MAHAMQKGGSDKNVRKALAFARAEAKGGAESWRWCGNHDVPTFAPNICARQVEGGAKAGVGLGAIMTLGDGAETAMDAFATGGAVYATETRID